MTEINHSLHARFEAGSPQRLRRVPLYAPALIWVREGTKRLQTHGVPLSCDAGKCLCLPAGETHLMENLPGPRGRYQAELFMPPRHWTERFLQHYAALLPDQWSPEAVFDCPPILAQQLQTLITLAAQPSALDLTRLEHGWQGALLSLAASGRAAPLFHLQPFTLTLRCQSLLNLDLARPWQAAELASRLGMSESSLRRGLRQEATSFSELLGELRLGCAFTRVMTERAPLLQIAQECGFQSPSRFSLRFRQRFGMSPKALRLSRAVTTPEPLTENG